MSRFSPPPAGRTWSRPLNHRRLAPLLALVVALVPLALDAYLPAFPAIAADLGVTSSEVGLTLSVYVFLLAVGQLVGGPLSDRYGRRDVLFAGLGIFLLGSLLVTTATTLSWMLLCRGIQAFGGGWVAVSVPAIVRDRTEGLETARLFSLISLIMFLAPALAPAVGTALLVVVGWRGIFEFLAGYAVLVGVLLQLLLFRREPRSAARAGEPVRTLITNYVHVLRHGTTMMLVALRAICFSVLLVYLTHVPFLLQTWLGLSSTAFAAVLAANVLAMACVAAFNRRLVRHVSLATILAVAVRFQTVAIVLVLAVTLLDVPRVLMIPALMLVVAAMGAIAPNVQAAVMQYYRELGGTAAAVLGAVQFAVGGLISAASAVLVADQAWRVPASMLACSIAASLLMVPIGVRLTAEQPVESVP